jgi:hypothetical protein
MKRRAMSTLLFLFLLSLIVIERSFNSAGEDNVSIAFSSNEVSGLLLLSKKLYPMAQKADDRRPILAEDA